MVISCLIIRILDGSDLNNIILAVPGIELASLALGIGMLVPALRFLVAQLIFNNDGFPVLILLRFNYIVLLAGNIPLWILQPARQPRNTGSIVLDRGVSLPLLGGARLEVAACGVGDGVWGVAVRESSFLMHLVLEISDRIIILLFKKTLPLISLRRPTVI